MRKRRKFRIPGRHPLRVKPIKRHVAILTPCGDQVQTGYAMSMFKMLERTYTKPPTGLEGLYLNTLSSSILPQGRQALAELAIKNGATHLLWIDSDMTFPADMLERLMARDEEVIGINAVTRRPPHMNCAQYADGTFVNTNSDSQGLEKVHRTGFGVLWHAASIMEAMQKPYFQFEWDESLQDFTGEDYFFFASVRKQGLEIYIDHSLSKQILHLGQYGFSPLMASRKEE